MNERGGRVIGITSEAEAGEREVSRLELGQGSLARWPTERSPVT